jgi:spore maturation protein CgeB
MPANIRTVGHVGTADHNAFFCSARATLNVNRESMARYGFSPPTRVFEAAGSGACLITDEWTGIDLFLEPDREVLVAADGSAVAAHLDALSPERARSIGERGRARILAHHTYRHRARQFNNLLEGMDSRIEAAE